jgi:hypothetical protein
MRQRRRVAFAHESEYRRLIDVDPVGLIEDAEGNPSLILKEAARNSSSLFNSYKSRLVETG